jgi:hypothetical protein
MCLGAIYWAHLSRIHFGNLAADASKVGFDDSFIYQQIAQPFSQRKIPMLQMMREEALAALILSGLGYMLLILIWQYARRPIPIPSTAKCRGACCGRPHWYRYGSMVRSKDVPCAHQFQ